ncbi:type II secretion system F family protein [Nocardia sp. NPDC050406]|uniref:type II secretion system F family protein n=1 Tax=Nocardia sp. NPDC050406 TaxID=3364318 RepID=UPI0037B827B7
MTTLVGYPSTVLVCLAFAALTAPAPPASRRLAALLPHARKRRKLPFRWGFRLAGVVLPLTLLGIGVGPTIAAALVVATVSLRSRRARRGRRRAAELGRLVDGLEVVIGELRVGAHPSVAAETAAQEISGESSRAFAVSAARSRLGGSGADGMRDPKSVVAEELFRIADAWRVADRHGLALAELLTAARLDLLGRKRFHARTQAALAGARATATVLSCLPLLGIALGQLMGASPLRVLLTSSAGTVLLPLGTALACLGLLWTDSITRKALR